MGKSRAQAASAKTGGLLLAKDVALSMPSRRSGKGCRKKKMLKKYDQSHQLYENKQISGKMPVDKSDIYV
jgi:hypothetical protein